MIVRAFTYEDAVTPGSALVVGSAGVALPAAAGGTGFAGIYSADGNVEKTRPDTDDTIGITVHGLCKVRAKGAVTAFAFGQIADATGAMEALANPPDAPIKVPGFFLESGADGEIVEFFVEPSFIPATVA